MSTTETKINNTNLDLFLNMVDKYSFERNNSCHELYSTFKSIEFKLKDEIFSNLVMLSEFGQKPYLLNVKLKISYFYEWFRGDYEVIQEYYNKYDCEEFQAFKYSKSNILSCILFEKPINEITEIELSMLNWPKNANQIRLIFGITQYAYMQTKYYSLFENI